MSKANWAASIEGIAHRITAVSEQPAGACCFCSKAAVALRPYLVPLWLIVFNLFATAAQAAPAPDTEPLTVCPAGSTSMALTFGDAVECEIVETGNTDEFYEFTFQGTKHSRVKLALFNVNGNCRTPPYNCPSLTVRDPDQRQFRKIEYAMFGASVGLRLDKSGTYTIRVSEYKHDQSVRFQIGLERLFPFSPNKEDLSFEGSETPPKTIDPVVDEDYFTFDAYEGSKVTVTLRDLDGNCADDNCPSMSVFGPDETEIASIPWVDGKGSVDVTLPDNGVYLIRVYEYDHDQTATYTVDLECASPAPGQSVCGPPNESKCNGLLATKVGTPGDDDLFGTDGKDVIVGLGGNDHIAGLGGDDVICGESDGEGSGKDVLEGGDGDDLLIGNDGTDVLIGDAGKDKLQGGRGNDTLIGGKAEDDLDGGENDDVLLGNDGDDVLEGNTGNRDACDAEGDSTAPTGCEIIIGP